MMPYMVVAFAAGHKAERRTEKKQKKYDILLDKSGLIC